MMQGRAMMESRAAGPQEYFRPVDADQRAIMEVAAAGDMDAAVTAPHARLVRLRNTDATIDQGPS
jgi:hypothetical protein